MLDSTQERTLHRNALGRHEATRVEVSATSLGSVTQCNIYSGKNTDLTPINGLRNKELRGWGRGCPRTSAVASAVERSAHMAAATHDR